MLSPVELAQILKEAEGPRLEFKLLYDLQKPNDDEKKNELTKDITSLANTAGRTAADFAYLIIGAGDLMAPSGVRPSRDVRADGHTANRFLSIVNSRIYPPLPNLNYAEIEVGGNYYGVIEIPPSPHAHEFIKDLKTPSGKIWHKHEVVIRRGDAIGTASVPELHLMRTEKESWSKTAVPPLKKLTEWLSDSTKVTQTAELIREETNSLYRKLNEPEFLQQEKNLTLTDLPNRINTYDQLVYDFAQLFAFGCFHGYPEFKAIWPRALSAVGQPDRRAYGLEAFLKLRFYPSLLLLYAGGLSSIINHRYENLAALFNETKIQIYERGPNSVVFSLVMPRMLSEHEQKFLVEAISPKLKLNVHLLTALTSILEDLVHSPDDIYDSFVRFEYLFALLVYQQEGGPVLGLFNTEREFRNGHQQYGKPTLPVISQTDEELTRLGIEWPPLKYGIFTGPLEVFKVFKAKADEALLRRGANAIFEH